MTYDIVPNSISYDQKMAIKNQATGLKSGDFPLVAFFVFFPSFALWGGLFNNGTFGFLFAIFTVVAVGVVINMRSKAKDEKRMIDFEEDKNIKTAINVQNILNKNLEETQNIKINLPTFLRQASDNLKRAEFEYKENAYGPFWDAVEQAAQHLSEFNNGVNKLKENTTSYYLQLVSVHRHTFPVQYPLGFEDLPEIRPAMDELSRVIRLGQTNYQFANIWEQRRTRQVLIAGFKTLGEALNNLGSVIETSVSELKTSISENMSVLASEQVKTRESIEGFAKQQKQFGDDYSTKLDNIQRKRKPLI